MSGICEGRVCIITGAGRGIGREHALMLAGQGAKIVVNDLGGDDDRRGRTTPAPAQQVVAEIEAMGGEAVANGDDVSDFDGAGELVQQAIDPFGRLDVLVNNAGILRDRMLVNMTEAEWDAVIAVHLKGTFGPTRARRRLLAGAGQGRRDRRRPHHQHHLAVGHLRQRRPDQLRRGQGRHRRVHDHRGDGARALRRDRQRHRPGRPHPHDRGPRHGPARRGDQGGDVAALDRPDRHLAGQRRVRRASPAGSSTCPAASWPSPRAGTRARRSSRPTIPPRSAPRWPS